MQRFTSGAIGVASGNDEVFSDFADNGEMWTGDGPRARRKLIEFDEPFRAPPVVHVSVSLWDVNQNKNFRADVSAEEVTKAGFYLVFRTWGDSKVARIRMNWMAIGQLHYADDWDVR